MVTSNQNVRDTISAIVSGKVLFDEPMRFHTSMGVGGTADMLVSPGAVKELERVVSCLARIGVPFVPVGNCTNLIVRDGGYRGAIVSLRNLTEMRLERIEGESCYLYAEAGVSLSRIVELTVRESLSGLEFCAGIPGSVGGGTKMNAGAYGSELKDVITAIVVVNGSGSVRETFRDELWFEYRNLELTEGIVIVSATFCLTKGSEEGIRQKVAEIIETRRNIHPLGYRSAGSVFKNPPAQPAGKIIDEIGLKGLQIGNAKISEQHGNFIVNLGNASARDVIALVEIIQRTVLEKRGVSLEPEIKIIGDE